MENATGKEGLKSSKSVNQVPGIVIALTWVSKKAPEARQGDFLIEKEFLLKSRLSKPAVIAAGVNYPLPVPPLKFCLGRGS